MVLKSIMNFKQYHNQATGLTEDNFAGAGGVFGPNAGGEGNGWLAGDGAYPAMGLFGGKVKKISKKRKKAKGRKKRKKKRKLGELSPQPTFGPVQTRPLDKSGVTMALREFYSEGVANNLLNKAYGAYADGVESAAHNVVSPVIRTAGKLTGQKDVDASVDKFKQDVTNIKNDAQGQTADTLGADQTNPAEQEGIVLQQAGIDQTVNGIIAQVENLSKASKQQVKSKLLQALQSMT